MVNAGSSAFTRSKTESTTDARIPTVKFSKAQNEAVLRIFDLVVGADRASLRSRKATLQNIQKMRSVLEAELRLRVVELEMAIFKDDHAKITREIKKLKKNIRQTTEFRRLIAKHAADKEVAGAVTATLL